MAHFLGESLSHRLGDVALVVSELVNNVWFTVAVRSSSKHLAVRAELGREAVGAAAVNACPSVEGEFPLCSAGRRDRACGVAGDQGQGGTEDPRDLHL